MVDFDDFKNVKFLWAYSFIYKKEFLPKTNKIWQPKFIYFVKLFQINKL